MCIAGTISNMQGNTVAKSVANDAGGMSSAEQIGMVRADYETHTVTGPDGTITLEPKVMAVLRVLSAMAPAVVSRESLIEQVWGGESGGDESLSRAVSLLRKALGDRRGQQNYIETIPRRGYRLVAAVSPIENVALQTMAARAGRSRLSWMVTAGLVVIALIGFLGLKLASDDGSAVLTPSPSRSVAVLPFADLSPAADHAYFAAGLAEEILNALTNIPELQVAGRTSSFAYAEKDADIRQIGSELGVNYVLEGAVRKDGEQLRITTQLVRADSGYHVWSRTFDGQVGSVFDFQENIARDIADALEISLAPERTARLVPALTLSQPAYDAFLQGRSLARRFGPEDKQRAAALLEQAVQLDPQFAIAWAELARTQLFLPVSFPELRRMPYVAAARDAVQRALAIDPGLAMGHYVNGLIQEFELRYDDALASFGRAHQLDPGNPFLMSRYGYFLTLIGHPDEGAELMTRGLRLDPTDAAALGNLGVARLAQGDVAAALQLIQRSYDLGFAPMGPRLAQLLWAHGDKAAATDIWLQSREALAGRFLPELETEQGWARLGRLTLEGDAEERKWVTDVVQRYFAQPDARANAYRLGVMVDAGLTAEAFLLLREKPFPISAGFVAWVWVAAGESAAPSTDASFPEFAKNIGLVEAWEEFGWPARCTNLPAVGESDLQFWCE